MFAMRTRRSPIERRTRRPALGSLDYGVAALVNKSPELETVKGELKFLLALVLDALDSARKLKATGCEITRRELHEWAESDYPGSLPWIAATIGASEAFVSRTRSEIMAALRMPAAVAA